MSDEIPKYVATAEAEEEIITFYGAGETPEEALSEFNAQAILDYAQYWEVSDGSEIEVDVYTAGTPGEAGWDEEDANPDWSWCLINKVSTHIVILEKD